MNDYIVHYTTRSARGVEVHRTFKVKATSKDIARTKADLSLRRKKCYTRYPYSTYVYNVCEVE